MGSGREFERDEGSGEQAGTPASGNHDGQRDEAFFEDRAQDAAQWLAGCRAARERGEPDHTVGATDVADPALAELMSQLTTAVGHMVAFDPVGRDGKDLLEYCAELHTQLARLASVTASATRAYDNSGEWVLKARTPAARIAHRCQLPPAKVRGEVRLGRNLTTMPHTDTALAAGDISEDHTRKLAVFASNERTKQAFAEWEEILVGWAKELPWTKFCDELRTWQLLVDPDGAEDNAAADEANRRVHLSGGLEGTGILNGVLTPYAYATVKAALDAIHDELLEDDRAEARERLGREPSFLELARSRPQRMHDALARMAERSQAVAPDTARPAPLVSIVLGRDAFAEAVSRIENTNTIVTPGTVARIFDDHRGEVLIQRIIFEDDPTIVKVSDARCFTGRLRRAIETRDQTCQWPGCDTPAVACHVDHIIEHTNGGPTSLTNGQALCRPHNLIKERIRKLNTRRQRAP